MLRLHPDRQRGEVVGLGAMAERAVCAARGSAVEVLHEERPEHRGYRGGGVPDHGRDGVVVERAQEAAAGVRRGADRRRAQELLHLEQRHRPQRDRVRRPERAQRGQRDLAAARGTRPARCDREGRPRRERQDAHERGQLVRGRGGELPVRPQHLRRLGERIAHEAAVHRVDRVHAQRKAGDHAEVAAATPETPEQVGVLVGRHP